MSSRESRNMKYLMISNIIGLVISIISVGVFSFMYLVSEKNKYLYDITETFLQLTLLFCITCLILIGRDKN